MKPETYFHFMNRGFRRCGTYYYKPLNDITCCPLYTIRCDAKEFVLSQSQKKVLKTCRKFLLYGKEAISKKTETKEINARGDEASSLNSKANPSKQRTVIPPTQKPVTTSDKSKKAKTIRYNRKMDDLKRQSKGDENIFEQLVCEYKNRRLRRLERYKPKTLSEYLDFTSLDKPKHFLEVRTLRCHPEHPDFTKSKKAEHKLYEKYQCSVHNDPPAKVTMSQFDQFLVAGGLHHNRTCDKIDLAHPRRDLPQGQYHQQYWLDGHTLIAVGVVDIVARCLSSVYLFYDPDYAFLDLGVLSALMEINFINELRVAFDRDGTHDDTDDFRYYYMGFYVHTCPKMRYKAQYHGSMLLCPVAMSWVPMDACRRVLDRAAYGRFSPVDAPPDARGVDQRSMQQLAAVMNVVVEKRAYRLTRYLDRLRPAFATKLQEFARLIGSQLLSAVRIQL